MRIFRAVQAIALSILLFLFAVIVCITHPIFVLTTAISLSISGTKIAYALLRRKLHSLWQKGEQKGLQENASESQHSYSTEEFSQAQSLNLSDFGTKSENSDVVEPRVQV